METSAAPLGEPGTASVSDVSCYALLSGLIEATYASAAGVQPCELGVTVPGWDRLRKRALSRAYAHLLDRADPDEEPQVRNALMNPTWH